MPILIFLLTLLIVPYWALLPLGWREGVRGRVGLVLLFAFTGLGHFFKTAEMALMLPAWTPGRTAVVYASGVFEWAAAVALLVPSLARPIGWVLILFLLAVLPSNIYAAIERVPFGGHEAGPAYLWIRVPVQFLLIGWIYWFAVRTPAE